MKKLEISEEVIGVLREDLAQGSEKEQFGLLLGQQAKVCSRVAARSKSWRTGFELDPRWLLEQLYQARENKVRILGFYHSHPEGSRLEPSQADLDGHPIASKVLICSGDQDCFHWALFELRSMENNSGFRLLRASQPWSSVRPLRWRET